MEDVVMENMSLEEIKDLYMKGKEGIKLSEITKERDIVYKPRLVATGEENRAKIFTEKFNEAVRYNAENFYKTDSYVTKRKGKTEWEKLKYVFVSQEMFEIETGTSINPAKLYSITSETKFEPMSEEEAFSAFRRYPVVGNTMKDFRDSVNYLGKGGEALIDEAMKVFVLTISANLIAKGKKPKLTVLE